MHRHADRSRTDPAVEQRALAGDGRDLPAAGRRLARSRSTARCGVSCGCCSGACRRAAVLALVARPLDGGARAGAAGHAWPRRRARIDVADLGRRLPVRGAGDELDEVAHAFNETLARLEQAVAEMRQFSAAIAHELRTPLAVLRGETELALMQAATPEDYRRGADRPARGARHAVAAHQPAADAGARRGRRDPAGARAGRSRPRWPCRSSSSSSRWRRRRALRLSARRRRAGRRFSATPAGSSACCSTCSTTRSSSRRQGGRDLGPRRDATARTPCSRSATPASASRPRRSRTSSSASFAPIRPGRPLPRAPGWA